MTNLTGTPSTNNKLYGLDHLRTIAITYVFIFHYATSFTHPQWVLTMGRFGWSGVDLFFVLSGYLIASQLFAKIGEGEKISLKVFFLKRFFRIIPAYLVVVAIYFFIPFFRETESLPPMWRFLTFTQNFGLDKLNYGTFSHAWSLCVEEHFYFFFPLILAALLFFKKEKKGYIVILLLFICGFIFRIYSWQKYIEPTIDTDAFSYNWLTYIYYPTYNRLDGLLTGLSIAALCQFLPVVSKKIMKYGTLLLCLSLIILAFTFYFSLGYTFASSVLIFPLVSIAYGLLVLVAISPESFLYKFNSKLTAFIANLSYALYLTHKGIIHITQQQFEKSGIAADSTTMFILCIVFSILAAFMLNRIIERPFLKLRDYILKSK